MISFTIYKKPTHVYVSGCIKNNLEWHRNRSLGREKKGDFNILFYIFLDCLSIYSMHALCSVKM